MTALLLKVHVFSIWFKATQDMSFCAYLKVLGGKTFCKTSPQVGMVQEVRYKYSILLAQNPTSNQQRHWSGIIRLEWEVSGTNGRSSAKTNRQSKLKQTELCECLSTATTPQPTTHNSWPTSDSAQGAVPCSPASHPMPSSSKNDEGFKKKLYKQPKCAPNCLLRSVDSIRSKINNSRLIPHIMSA